MPISIASLMLLCKEKLKNGSTDRSGVPDREITGLAGEMPKMVAGEKSGN